MGSNCLYNIDHLKLYGVEIEATLQPLKRLLVTAAYVYQDFDVEETGFEEDWTYYLPATLPNHKAKLLARCMLWTGGWLHLSSRYVSQRDAQKGAELDAYGLLDIGFEQIFGFDGQKYTASVFCNNVSGTVYEEQSGYKMPRFVWGFQLGAKF